MRDRTALHPDLQGKLARLESACKAAGLKIGIGECVRTVAEQDALYAQGRTKPGAIVTKAKGSSYSSMHQWGVAFDFYRADGAGAYNDADGFFRKVGQLGKGLGLMWGGDWVSIVDKPHFQLPDWGTGPAKLKAEYGTPERFRAAWPKEEEEMTQEQFNAMFETAMAAHEKAVNAETVSTWAAEAMAKAKEKGLLDGTKPKAAVTREQLAVVLDRLGAGR